MRPLWVASTASWGSGPTTPTTSSASLRAATCASSAPSAAAVAELHATTRSFAPRPSSSSAIWSAKPSSWSAERSPYGNRAVSPRYRKSSCGSATSSSCRTVKPPTPESKTPIGRRRGSSGGIMGVSLARATDGLRPPMWPASARLAGVADGVDGALHLLDHHVLDARSVGVAAGLDDGRQDDRHEQHQPHVLDRALTALGAETQQGRVE